MSAHTAAPVWAVAIGLVVFLFAFSNAVAQGPPGGQGPPGSGTPGQGPPGNNSPGEDGAGKGPPDHAANRSQGQGPRGPPPGVPGADQRPGRAQLTSDGLDGRYVRFTLNASQGLVTGYEVGGRIYFDSIQFPGPIDASAQGAHAWLRSDNASAAVTDNPTGLLRVHQAEQDVVLQPADGVEVIVNGSRVELRLGNTSAFVTNATFDNGTLILRHGIFLLRGSAVADSAQAAAEARIENAIAQGHVAARVQVLDEGADVLDFQGARVEARTTANGSHRFIVDGNFTTGRVFVVDFAPGLLRAQELGVAYYDEVAGVLVPAAIQRADNLADLLEILPGEGPKWWRVTADEGEQVLVAVPSFSVHAFDVYTLQPSVVPGILWGLVAGMLLVAILGVGAFAGRRDSD